MGTSRDAITVGPHPVTRITARDSKPVAARTNSLRGPSIEEILLATILHLPVEVVLGPLHPLPADLRAKPKTDRRCRLRCVSQDPVEGIQAGDPGCTGWIGSSLKP